MSAAGASNGESEVVEEPGEVVTVEAEEPESEGGDAGPAAALTEEQRETRKERRANKMREERTARETAERSARELSDRVARAERETAELRGFVAANAQRQQGDPKAELTASVDRLENEAQEHLQRSALAAKAGDTAMAARELKAFNAKNREAARLEMRAEFQPELERRIGEVRGNIPTPEIQAARESILQEFPWVRTDGEARAAVDAKFQALVAAGRPGTFDTIREAAAAIAKRMGIGGRQAPSQDSRQRHQAVPSGEGAGGGEGNVQIVMGEKEKRLAHAAYRNLEPKEAEKAAARDWAKAKKRGEW